jgi:chromosome segregation ATPase
MNELLEKNIIKYNVTDEAILNLSKDYSRLQIEPGNAKHYKLVTEAIGAVRKLRTSVEKKRKELKAEALEYGRKVDGEAKRITGKLLAIEDPLKEKKKTEDDRKAKIKAEKEEAARKRKEAIEKDIASIRDLIVDISSLDIESLENLKTEVSAIEITTERFAEFGIVAMQTKDSVLGVIDQELNQKKEAEKLKAEREEIEKQKAELEAEKKRVSDLQKKLDARNKPEPEPETPEPVPESKNESDIKVWTEESDTIDEKVFDTYVDAKGIHVGVDPAAVDGDKTAKTTVKGNEVVNIETENKNYVAIDIASAQKWIDHLQAISTPKFKNEIFINFANKIESAIEDFRFIMENH